MSSMWDDMPQAVDPDDHGYPSRGFIPPPPDAHYEGFYDAFPGTSQSSHGHGQGQGHGWTSSHGHGTPWPTSNQQSSPWSQSPPQHQQQQQQYQPQQPAPPTSAHSWTYGQYPAHTPSPPWGPTTPDTWGTPGTWGPTTPASGGSAGGGNGASPWVQTQQGAFFPPGHKEAFVQPVGASPWFGSGGGSVGHGDMGGGSVGGHSSMSGTESRKKKKKQQQQQQQMGYGYPEYPKHLAPALTQQQQMQMYMQGGMDGMSMGGSIGSDYGRSIGRRLKRSTSWDTSEYPAYAQPDSYSERNLARRPLDWRADYNTPSRSGLSSLLPRIGKNRSDVKEYTDGVKRTLHPLLLFTSPNPPIYHDLRETPDAIEFLNIKRPHNDLDFAQLATQPPASILRLYHPRLPWYIDIKQTHTNGVTVFDVLMQMYGQLSAQVSGRHYWNEELDTVDRADIGMAYNARCAGDPEISSAGVRQVDFLLRKVIFEGLARGRNGMWEIKTRKYE